LQGGAARRRENAAPARSLEQLPGSSVARSGTVEQSDGDVDAEASEIGRVVPKQARKLDHIDRRGKRGRFDLKQDPSSATSICACNKHKDLKALTFEK
jgi:hypothetical protein